MRENPLAFLDIETTGLNPNKHDVLEVAYIIDDRHRDPARDDREEHFALAIWEQRADLTALQVNRYHERREELSAIQLHLAAGVTKLRDDLRDAIIVGANPQFDIAFLRQFLWRIAGAEPTWHYRCIDLNTLAAGWVGDPLPMPTADIATEFNVPLSDKQHTALADARWNRDAYFAILAADPCS